MAPIQKDTILDLDNSFRLPNLPSPPYAISGPLFSKLSQQERTQILNDTLVFARCSPENKKDIVKGLQDLGKTVAMVGDDANDCGALKQANVGVSLAISQASIAAHYTATDSTVHSIIDIIKFSRA